MGSTIKFRRHLLPRCNNIFNCGIVKNQISGYHKNFKEIQLNGGCIFDCYNNQYWINLNGVTKIYRYDNL